MKSPPDQAVGYTVTVVIAAVVLFVVIGVLSSMFLVPPQAVTRNQENPPVVKELETFRLEHAPIAISGLDGQPT